MSDALMLAVWAVGCFLAGWLACEWWQDRKVGPRRPLAPVEPIEVVAKVIWWESIEPFCRKPVLGRVDGCVWGLTLDCPCQDRAFALASAVMEPEKEPME